MSENQKCFFIMAIDNYGVMIPSGIPKNVLCGIVNDEDLTNWAENNYKLTIKYPKCIIDHIKMSNDGRQIESINAMLVPLYSDRIATFQEYVVINPSSVEIIGEVVTELDNNTYRFINLQDNRNNDIIVRLLKEYNTFIFDWEAQFSNIIKPSPNAIVEANNKYKIVL